MPHRYRRPNVAVATTGQGLNPVRAGARFFKNTAQRGNLNRQIAVLDRKPGPGSLDQSVFGNRIAFPLQKQSKQRNRALTQHGRFSIAKQYAGVGVDAERTKFMDYCHRLAPFGNILQYFRKDDLRLS